MATALDFDKFAVQLPRSRHHISVPRGGPAQS
jgi:hypothetical protein